MTGERTLRIGVTGPFSGPRSAYGQLLLAASRARADEFQLVLADDEASPERAVPAAGTLVGEGVAAVIGHFNSDCARVAGPIYRRAGIPFLMPASTAPDLVGSSGGIRICPDDAQQIEAMTAWLSRKADGVEIEDDGSPYGIRLAGMLRRAWPATPERHAAHGRSPVRAILGTHRAVARRIREAGTRQGVLAPDDCAIPEFQELLGSRAGDGIFVARPQPTFSQAVAIAFTLLSRARARGGELGDALRRDPSIVEGQFAGASFAVEPLQTGRTADASLHPADDGCSMP